MKRLIILVVLLLSLFVWTAYGMSSGLIAYIQQPDYSFTFIDIGAATQGFGINNAGHVVGIFYYQAFLWTGPGCYTVFDFPGAITTCAFSINDADQIVGTYRASNRSFHGFLKTGEDFISIDYPGARNTWLCAINNAGDILGYIHNAEGTGVSFFIKKADEYVILDELIGGPESWARPAGDINNNGQIVLGTAGINDFGEFAVYSITRYRGRAFDINNAGQTVGYVIVPLPGSLLFLGAGLVCLIGFRKFKKN